MSEALTPKPPFILHPITHACLLTGMLSASFSVLAQTAPAAVTDLGRIEIRSNRDNDTEVRRESTAVSYTHLTLPTKRIV